MNLVHERFIVKHRVTHEKFLLKIITDEAAEEIKLQVNTELLALQKCIRNEGIINLIDYFTNAQGCTYIVTQLPSLNLKDYLQSLSYESFHAWNVAFLLRKLASILDKMHQKKVIHRDIRAENIAVNVSSKECPSHSKENKNSITASIKLHISDFDLAFCFNNEAEEVNQGFNIPGRRFAPEIEATQAHGPPVDVWGLSQIAHQLLKRLS